MRIRRALFLTASLVVGFVHQLASQDEMGRRASMFDLGIYAGGAWTTNWFDAGDNFNDLGVALRGGVEMPTNLSGLDLRGELGFSRLFGLGDNEFDVLSVAVGATYTVSAPYYAGGGVGLFRGSPNCEQCRSETDPGFQVYVGGPLTDRIGAEAGTDFFAGRRLLKVGVVVDLR